MNKEPRYAIYFVPAAESTLYRFGSSVLGYDCYTGEASTHPDELMHEPRTWGRMVEEPQRYGFHATLKAPFHLASGCTEGRLIDAVESFAASGHAIPVIAPVIGMLSGFAAILARQPEPTLDALAERCTSVFDSYRAPRCRSRSERDGPQRA